MAGVYLKQGASMDEFDEWWACYPRKIGKLAARKAHAKARRQATQEDLIEGVTQYIRNKPAYADFAHPATWLTQGRWMDEWQAPPKPVQVAQVDWFEECQRLHGRKCNGQYGHDMQMYIDKQKAAAR